MGNIQEWNLRSDMPRLFIWFHDPYWNLFSFGPPFDLRNLLDDLAELSGLEANGSARARFSSPMFRFIWGRICWAAWSFRKVSYPLDILACPSSRPGWTTNCALNFLFWENRWRICLSLSQVGWNWSNVFTLRTIALSHFPLKKIEKLLWDWIWSGPELKNPMCIL